MQPLIDIIKAHPNPNATPAEIIAIAAVPVYRRVLRYTAVSILAGSLDGLKAFANALDPVGAFKTRRLVDGLLGGLVEIAAEDMPLVAQLAPMALAESVITQEQATALLAAGTERAAFTATEADVIAAKAEIAAEKNRDELQNLLTQREALVKGEIADGTWTTWDQVKQALGA